MKKALNLFRISASEQPYKQESMNQKRHDFFDS